LLLVACKAAGAVAQLPRLVLQLRPILQQQSWWQDMARSAWGVRLMSSNLLADFVDVAMWSLLLAPVLGLLLPGDQAAQLQGLAKDAMDAAGSIVVTVSGDLVRQLLGLLGQVGSAGTPGCSYPGCCNLAGRSESELPLQVCTKCRGARYCGREHQVAHWNAGHKEVCKAAKAAVQQVHSSAAS
jgi:hypothetical protein